MGKFFKLNQSAADCLIQARKKVLHCLNQLEPEQIWWRPHPNMNSIGNLILHLAGNLNQWGVIPITKADDRRDRDSEFGRQWNLDAKALVDTLSNTVDQACEAWETLDDQKLQQTLKIQGFEVTLLHAILHTTTHFVGHTHQIIQLCRLQLGDAYQFQWSPDDDRTSVPI